MLRSQLHTLILILLINFLDTFWSSVLTDRIVQEIQFSDSLDLDFINWKVISRIRFVDVIITGPKTWFCSQERSHISSRWQLVWIQSFLLLDQCHTKFKSPIFSYLPIAGRLIVGYIPYPMWNTNSLFQG